MSDLIQRYNFKIDFMADCYCETEENSQGDYVDYEDYKKLEASNAELKKELTKIANIAHHGGLLDLGDDDFSTAIRRLTVQYWDKDECTRLQLKLNPDLVRKAMED